MICPQCGNTITMQEYRCSKCNLDLHCSTPEGRQKAEQYANQMYASGQWKLPELKLEESIVHTAIESKVIKEKPKRNVFTIISAVLGIALIISIALLSRAISRMEEAYQDMSELREELNSVHSELDEKNALVEELEKPMIIWQHTFSDGDKELSASIYKSHNTGKSLNIATTLKGDYYNDIEALKQDAASSFNVLYLLINDYNINDVSFMCIHDNKEHVFVTLKDKKVQMAFGSDQNGERSEWAAPEWFKTAIDERSNGSSDILPQSASNFAWFTSTYKTIGEAWGILE